MKVLNVPLYIKIKYCSFLANAFLFPYRNGVVFVFLVSFGTEFESREGGKLLYDLDS